VAHVEPTDSAPTCREYAVQALLLLALVAAAFPGVFLRGECAAPGDVLLQCPPWDQYAPAGWERAQNPLLFDILSAFAPWYHLTEQALEDGEWPLWNHLQLTGVPLLANCQSAVLYPPRLLHSVFGLALATTLFVLLKLWLSGMTAYWCGRVIGLGVPAARFLSVAWMLSGYTLIWSCWGVADVGVWFPVLYAGADLLLRGRYRRGFAAATVGGSLTLLAGHPESALTFAMAVSVYVVLRAVLERRWPALAAWAGAGAVAGLIGAAQLLPFLEYLRHSFGELTTRNVGPHPGYPLSGLLCGWVPRFFGTDADQNYWGELDPNRNFMVYAGITAWLGLCLLPVKARAKEARNWRTACTALVALLFVFVAFDAPAFGFLRGLPVIGLLKRTYYIAFPVFALAVLGAAGLDRWFARPRKLREARWGVLGAAAIGTVLLVACRFYGDLVRMMDFGPYLATQLAWCLVLLAAGLAVLLVSCYWHRPRLLMALITALVAVDLLGAAHGLNATYPPEGLYPETRLTEFLRGQPQPCRIQLQQGLMGSGFMTPYGIEEISGYDGIYPERLLRLQHALKDDVWNAFEPVFGVQYYLHSPEYEAQFPIEEKNRFERVAHIDGLDVYRNNRAYPRAFLVPRARVVPDAEDLFEALRDPAFDAREVVLLEKPPLAPLPEPSPGGPGRARVTHRSATRVTIEAQAAADCVLVLTDQYYPGWKARVDDEPVPVFPAYYAFRGIRLPAGEHTVTFDYGPLSFYAGLAISTAALLVSVFVAMRILWVRRALAG